MPIVSRPIMLTAAVALVGVGIYQYSSSQSPSGPLQSTKPQGAKATAKPTDFIKQDYTARYERLASKPSARNIFLPLVRNDNAGSSDVGAASKDILHIPGPLASGDPNWIYTGFAVINGEKSGLLENRSNHQSAFVKEGESWKSTRVVSIGSGSIVLDDLAGGRVPVMRYDEVLAAKSQSKAAPADTSLKPADTQLQGPIGAGAPGGPPPPSGPRIMMGGGQQQIIVNGAVMTLSDGK